MLTSFKNIPANSRVSWPITLNKIKNCLEQWLNESSSFASDASGKIVLEESVKQLSATPLNSVSPCQTQRWTCTDWHTAQEKVVNNPCPGSSLHKQQSPSSGLQHCHNWLHKQQSPSTGLWHCHNWLHKQQSPSTGLQHCHNWLHKQQSPSTGLQHCHNWLHKLQTLVYDIFPLTTATVVYDIFPPVTAITGYTNYKLQTLVYDIFPPTTAIIGYSLTTVKSLRKLSPNW